MRSRKTGQRDIADVIAEEREKDRPDIAGGLPAFPRRNSQRYTHQRQHQARDGQRESPVQFDARIRSVLSALRRLADKRPQLAGEHLAEWLGAFVSVPAATEARMPAWVRSSGRARRENPASSRVSCSRLFFTSGTACASRATVTAGPGCASLNPVLRSPGGVRSAMNTPFQCATEPVSDITSST